MTQLPNVPIFSRQFFRKSELAAVLCVISKMPTTKTKWSFNRGEINFESVDRNKRSL